MSASPEMVALVEMLRLAAGDAATARIMHMHGGQPSPLTMAIAAQANDALLAAIGEIERGRDAQAAEVERLREEVAALRAIDTTADEFVDALIAAWPAEDSPVPTALEAARYGLRRHLRRLREEVAASQAEVARVAGVAREACDGMQGASTLLRGEDIDPDGFYADAILGNSERLLSAIPTPDPAAFVAAVDAYGEAARLYGVTAGNGASWERLCADKEKASAARAALLALGGVR